MEYIKNVEDRVLILEIARNHFEKEMDEMKEDTKILKKGLTAIDNSIKQFRNIVIGIFIAVVAIEYGLLNTIKIALSAGVV